MTAVRRLVAAAVVAALTASTLHAQSAIVPEYSAKAGFLTTIARYAVWPGDAFPSPSSPIVIGVLGSDPFGEVLMDTAAASRGTRPIQVRHLRSPRDADGVHIVFIGKAEAQNEAGWIAALKDKPILTVGESGSTLERGGILQFVRIQDRIGFEVNLAAAQQAGVRLSSDLLAHAKRVVTQ